MTSISGIIMVAQYFDKRKGLAMALGTITSGVASPPLVILLYEYFTFEGLMLLLGGLALHCFISAALYRPLNSNFPKGGVYITFAYDAEIFGMKIWCDVVCSCYGKDILQYLH